MTDDRRRDDGTDKRESQGGRGGDPAKMGGASKPGHLSPQIDERDGKTAKGGKIAQGRQQASGQGSGQT